MNILNQYPKNETANPIPSYDYFLLVGNYLQPQGFEAFRRAQVDNDLLVRYGHIPNHAYSYFNMAALTDKSVMPFGQYKGRMLINVPALYLIWLHGEIKPKAPNKRSLGEKYLLEYIEDNMEVLKKEVNEDKSK